MRAETLRSEHLLARIALRLGKPDLALQQFKILAEAHPQSAEYQNELGGLYEYLGDKPAAVRSSSLIEDRPESNFAGQFESFLGVREDAEFLTALRACWAALWTTTARRSRSGAGGCSSAGS